MSLLGVSVLLIVMGGVGAIVLGRRPRAADGVFRWGVAGGCGLAAIASLSALLGRPPVPYALQPTLPGGIWILALDGLSAWFLLLLAIVGGITTVYGARYMTPERTHRSVAPAHATWSILLVAMIGVLVAQSAVLFLLAWEVMAVSAYFLVMFEHDRDDVRRAGLVYLVLTHVGTLGLLVMFLSWGHAAPDYSFASLALARAALPWSAGSVLLLALFGFGAKAGVVPLHFWLPGAHAAAPSHVSALLSGVMLKVGIYGLLRVVVLTGPPPAWWGWLVLMLGLVSAVLGVLWAVAQHDLKRALAYSSVENIGIILLGLGLGALGTAYHQPAVALLGYAGALLHTLNHALFKSLLFLGAGAVVRATGTREIDRLGGLARRMPRTAAAFLVGSIAIVGLPPLNGFIGEWTLARGFLAAGGALGPLRFASLGAAGLGLVSALALVCFTRLVGIVFLGRARAHPAVQATDAGAGMTLPMAVLAMLCVSIGLVPAAAMGLAGRVAADVAGMAGADDAALVDGGSAAALRLLGAAIVVVVLAGWALRRRGRETRRSSDTWACGFPAPTSRMQYTGSSFGRPTLEAFAMAASDPRYDGSGALRASLHDRVLRDVIPPLWDRVRAVLETVRPLQQGRVTAYLRYMVWTVLLLLGFLFFAASELRP